MARNPGRPLAISQRGAEALTLAIQGQPKAAHTAPTLGSQGARLFQPHAEMPEALQGPVTRLSHTWIPDPQKLRYKCVGTAT